MAKYRFSLKKREELAKETRDFWFDTSKADFTFRPGQYVDLTIENPPFTDAEGNKRTFSIASSPNEKDSILITTRMRDTAFKNSLKEVPLGTEFLIDGPMGNFTD